MRMLIDTVVTMNTGNRAYYQWVMSKFSIMVAEYIECDTNTEYDLVQLLATLDLRGTHQPIDHGSTTTFIRYRTSHLINNTSLFILYFDLSNDVALRNVFRIPWFLATSAVVDLFYGPLFCSELNQVLLLQLDPPGKGLPDGDYYIIFYATVSDGASYNVTPLSSPTQYTASERIITPGSQNTYSNNLVVLYDSFQRSISCELIYLSLQFK